MDLIVYLIINCFVNGVYNIYLERGFQNFDLSFKNEEQKTVNFTKSMYKGTVVSFTIKCNGSENFELRATFYRLPCNESEVVTKHRRKMSAQLPCHKNVIVEKEKLDKLYLVSEPIVTIPPVINIPKNATNSQTLHTTAATTAAATARQKRDVTNKKPNIKLDNNQVNSLPKILQKGVYVIILSFTGKKDQLSVKIMAKHGDSYLSVSNWPFLPFYGSMSLTYIFFAVIWFILSVCNWRDWLRIQFWIGAVIAIGMFENALFYTEYRNINANGEPNGLLYFAEFVSCIKRALARILVIIVSMGFGVVKPRLGQVLHKVLAAGALYMLLATIESCMKVSENEIYSRNHMFALIPLVLFDVAFAYWVFTSLVQTTRTLKIRKNVVKLTLYRHFTNTLVFTVIASLVYMVWIVRQTKEDQCRDIDTYWLYDALWPFLFIVILAVIMFLWRPSINNQRYAFTPLELNDSDDDNDMTLSDAFEGMKMRTKESTTVAKNRNRAEDDLKWVEENIPSVPSTLLPTLDSDEEILTTKFEISKMN